MDNLTRIPLFPLPLVLYPNMPLPLHIFEPRYREMVDLCVEEKKEFGVILTNHGRLYSQGTCARIENVLKRFPDGRMDILCLGKQRFEVQGFLEEKSFLEGYVQFFDDETEPEEDLEDLRQEAKALLDLYTSLSGKRSNSFFFDSFSPQTYSFFLAEINAYTLVQQQHLLESRSARHRLFKVLSGLRAIIERYRTNNRLQDLLGKDQDFFHILN